MEVRFLLGVGALRPGDLCLRSTHGGRIRGLGKRLGLPCTTDAVFAHVVVLMNRNWGIYEDKQTQAHLLELPETRGNIWRESDLHTFAQREQHLSSLLLGTPAHRPPGVAFTGSSSPLSANAQVPLGTAASLLKSASPVCTPDMRALSSYPAVLPKDAATKALQTSHGKLSGLQPDLSS